MHWNPARIPLNKLKSQGEYDEHFLKLFEQAVARRLSGATTLLAHLSGGMDSTANVCMADYIVRSRGLRARDYIDTLSFFDNSEPHWDEQPFFLAVEALRGKKGIHFDAGHSKRTFAPIDSTKAFYLFPGADGSTLNHEIALENALAGHDYKAILSGIGGDEILGGNPSYQPELADHLMAGRFITLIRNSFRWSLHKRRPLLHTLFDATVYSARAYFAASTQAVLPPWFSERTRSIFRHSHKDFHYGTRSIGIRPSAIGNAQSWVALQEALPNLQPGFLVRREYRYPYLDRDLAEFCFSIPPEQHVQPGRRRALMRRALRGIVPDIILERRRKAYIARAPWVRLTTHSDDIRQLLERSELVASGYVDRKGFIQAVDETIKGGTRHGEHFVIRALEVELWLRSKQASSPRQAIRDDKLTVLSEQSSTRSL